MLEHYNLDFEILDDMQRSIHLFRDLKVFFKIRILQSHSAKNSPHPCFKVGSIRKIGCNELWRTYNHSYFSWHVFHSYFGPLKTKIYILIERFLASKSSAIIAHIFKRAC